MQTPQDILQQHFGFQQFRGKQQAIIENLLHNKHSLVLMPTGGGKSLCYQIPALYFTGGTIVISPLIALMQDQVDALRGKGIPAEFINSTVSAEQRNNRLQRFVSGETKLLYVTPERFRKEPFIASLQSANISLLAVDEAHCISEWGHDFRPDYSRIAEFRERIGNPLTIALTATATREVQNDIINKLGLEKHEITIFHEGIERPNLRLEAIDVIEEKETLQEILNTIKQYEGSGIVYFSLIKKLERFSQLLYEARVPHGIYHGKLEAGERKRIQRDFLSGRQPIILATNAFGMGIDKPDIRFVIHAEIPSSVESYYQEIGRAGRDGQPSVCVLLYNKEDLYTQMDFIKWANPDADYYTKVFSMLQVEPEVIRSLGIEHIREQLSFKNRSDFRVETVLGMFDRYGVTEGEIENHTLQVVGTLPHELEDEEYLKAKLLRDNKKLLSMVNYFNTEHCRRVFIADYFGFPGSQPCGHCDVCDMQE